MSTTWDLQEKGGQAWEYNETNLDYNSVLDPDGGNGVYYNSSGLAPSYTLQAKS
jgi:hypothetical protein